MDVAHLAIKYHMVAEDCSNLRHVSHPARQQCSQENKIELKNSPFYTGDIPYDPSHIISSLCTPIEQLTQYVDDGGADGADGADLGSPTAA